MTKRKSKPTDAITVSTYARLEKFTRAFASGKLNLLFVIGRAGTGKSQAMRSLVGAEVCWIESNASPFGIYEKLYQHQNQLVVIDDVDSLYSDRSAVRLLKCLCQTDPVKNIAWHTAAAGGAGGGLPREFQTTSRVCIIANDWKDLDANTAAVQDRGHLIFFEPTPLEVHLQVANWFWDQAVFDWFGEHLHLIAEPSMRSYVKAYERKIAGIDEWPEMILSDVVSEKAMLVAKLRADSSFSSERERVKAFKEQGGGSHETWYRYKRKLKSPTEPPPRIQLKHAEPPKAQAHVGPSPARERGPELRVVRGLG